MNLLLADTSECATVWKSNRNKIAFARGSLDLDTRAPPAMRLSGRATSLYSASTPNASRLVREGHHSTREIDYMSKDPLLHRVPTLRKS